MIEFRLKDFSKIDKVEDLERGILILRSPLEFIKAVEMMNLNNGKDVYHWVRDKCINEMIVKFFMGNLGLSPQLAFSLAIEKDYSVLNDYFGINTVNIFRSRFGNNIGFIKKAINIMLTETKQGTGDLKYNTWFSDPRHKSKDPEEYVVIFKFLGLALSGQLPLYKIEDPYNYMYKVSNLKVDYSESPYKDINSIKRIMAYILSGICCVSENYSPIKKLMTYEAY